MKKEGHHTQRTLSSRSPLFDDFFYLGSLADSSSEIVQLRTSYLASSDDLNLLDLRRMQRPCLLNADSVGVLSDGECRSDTSALLLEHNALEYLDSLTVSFFDLRGNADGVAYVELRDLCLELSSFDVFNDVVHFSLLYPMFLMHETAAEDHLRDYNFCIISCFFRLGKQII